MQSLKKHELLLACLNVVRAENPSEYERLMSIMSQSLEASLSKPLETGPTDSSTDPSEYSVMDATNQKEHDYRNRELVHPTAIIYPGVIIGEGTRIGPYAVIGANPEHRDFWNREYQGVTIGKNCWIGTGVTIDSGTIRDTMVGDNVIILRHAHIGHDSIVGDDCEVSANAIVGGFVEMAYASVLGLGAITRQHLKIGRCSMLGMGGVLTKNIPDGEIWVGNAAHFLKKNIKRIEKYGY